MVFPFKKFKVKIQIHRYHGALAKNIDTIDSWLSQWRGLLCALVDLLKEITIIYFGDTYHRLFYFEPIIGSNI
jgi:hypothetical protein